MHTDFGPDFFSLNRARLREHVGAELPIAIAGNGVMQRGGDEPSPFYQDSNFWYLTGLNGADLTLVMTARDTYVIVPALSTVREAFDGAHDLQAYAARSGVTTFLPEREGWRRLQEELRKAGRAATLASPPVHLKQYGVYSLPFRRRLIARLKRLSPGVSVTDVRTVLAELRVIKRPEELRALQRAIDITGRTLQEIADPAVLNAAEYEYELEAALTYGFRKRGSEGHGFAPIVGAGKHSVTLHHMENNGPIGASDAIVLDVGASAEHYSADITRTVSKQPLTGRAAEVFHAVERIQDYALSLIKPGALYKAYELAVEQRMGEELRRLGLIDKHKPGHENIRHYFPHATSHFLGLDTHDVGDYREPLREGMVLTCEPGIYIPEEGLGVRIEDDVVVTAGGCQVLSAACPRRLTPVQ